MIAAVAWSQDGWLQQVEDLMNQGEFKKAEALMKSLPKKTQVAQEVRIDSLNTIMGRIRKDFTMTPEEGKKLILEKMPTATDAMIAKWKRDRKIEYMIIDGQEWWFRKSVRNLWLLAGELKEGQCRHRDHLLTTESDENRTEISDCHPVPRYGALHFLRQFPGQGAGREPLRGGSLPAAQLRAGMAVQPLFRRSDGNGLPFRHFL